MINLHSFRHCLWSACLHNLADAPAIATKPSPCAHHLSGPPVNSEVICAVGKRYWVPEFCWGSSTGQGGLTPDDGNTTKGVHADYDIDHDTADYLDQTDAMVGGLHTRHQQPKGNTYGRKRSNRGSRSSRERASR